MNLLTKRNSGKPYPGAGFRNEPYLILNIFFAGVIVLVFLYSGIFSPDRNDYPVVCIHQKLTGQPCLSCGLSHSFSLILRGRTSEANEWNIYGMRVFMFFAAQLFLRITFSFYYLRKISFRRQLIILDSAGSAAMFFITFWPFIRNILQGFIGQI